MGIIRQLVKMAAGLFVLFLSGDFAHSATQSGYGLYLSPEKCFVSGDDQYCDLLVSINWRVQQSASFCLFREGESKALQCWNNQLHGSFKLPILAKQDILFSLKSVKGNQVIFQTELKLFVATKKLTKKRRNPWSFY